MTTLPAMKVAAYSVLYAFRPELQMHRPMICDTEWINTSPLHDGYPVMFDPVFEQRTVLHSKRDLPRWFIGWERVKLRWMKPDGKGGLVPRG